MRRRLARTLLILGAALSSGAPTLAREVLVTQDDLTVTRTGIRIMPELTLLEVPESTPAVDPTETDPAYNLLRSLIARGSAQGFDGFVYDNRDRDHSRLSPKLFPRLTHLRYGPELTAANADYGLAGGILYPTIVLGNSSTALTSGPNARSQSRLAMTTPQGPVLTATAFLSNHLYVYPEHRDYDDVDRYPANWPYQVISQGSSRSDKPFLRALAATLAAFPPETVEVLRSRALVGSTLQMILRRNLRFVQSEDAYFDGTAHRPVLSGDDLNPERMIAQANALRPDAIPPLVRLEVVDETFSDANGLAQANERLFTTPLAIARIWRSFAWEQRIVVSVDGTRDTNGRDLTFSWHVLQGMPDKITITPLNDTGSEAEIRVQWHDPFELTYGLPRAPKTRITSRVDIGVFADNGAGPSAPALISISFPSHQDRIYRAPSDGPTAPRLVSIDYDALGRGAEFDPVLHWSAEWRDTARYSENGQLIGWDRVYADPSRAPEQIPHPDVSQRYGVDRVEGRPVLRDLSPEIE